MKWPWVDRKYKEMHERDRERISTFRSQLKKLHSLFEKGDERGIELGSPRNCVRNIYYSIQYNFLDAKWLGDYIERLDSKIKQELEDRRVRELAREVAREECGEDEE